MRAQMNIIITLHDDCVVQKQLFTVIVLFSNYLYEECKISHNNDLHKLPFKKLFHGLFNIMRFLLGLKSLECYLTYSHTCMAS